MRAAPSDASGEYSLRNVGPDCPFCSLDSDSIVWASELALAFRDSFPVSRGHTLIVPRRHVETWFDATVEEQRALMDGVDAVKRALDHSHRPDGFNVGFNAGLAAGQTVMHLHVHVIPRYEGDVDDPRGGVRFVIPVRGNYRRGGHIPVARDGVVDQLLVEPREQSLVTGGYADPLVRHLRSHLARTRDVATVAAFVTDSGVRLVEGWLLSALERGARVRVLTGDYLEFTQANALRHLLDLAQGDAVRREESDEAAGELELRVVEVEQSAHLGTSFHPKAWVCEDLGVAWVGSSNLTRAALLDGVEWNARIERDRDPRAFARVSSGFEDLWSQARVVDTTWIDAYAERTRKEGLAPASAETDGDSAAPAPTPRDVQLDALEALSESRAEGRRRAMVVMATGLGKTWVAAFDVDQWRREHGRAPRVLFMAHRVEILRQAASTFRRLDPKLRVGWCAGPWFQLDADLVLGSVQKLGREGFLDSIPADAFDYVVVDEVHHAHATTYRRVVGHLQPAFMLGLTATPERTDGGDVLGLFDDHLAYRADLGVGIVLGHLVPFRYLGLADTVDYQPIPWRNRRFDVAQLTSAVQTQARMQTLWEAWTAHEGTRSLVFCCSISHAHFARDWLSAQGVRAAAVHSGEDSDDRAGSLEALDEGHLDAVCTVDLFNEGVDMPRVDRVVMLRPTESPLLFLQQLGRGLRTAEGKSHCTVIDFVGNHAMFLDRVRALLDLTGQPDRGIRRVLAEGELDLPGGCSVRVELEAKDLLRRLLPTGEKHKVVRAYREHREARGERPRIGALYREGLNPRSLKTWESWFHFVDDEGDLSSEQIQVLRQVGDFLTSVERRESMSRSYKMVVLQVLVEADRLLEGMGVDELCERSHRLLLRSPELFEDLRGLKQLPHPRHPEPGVWKRYWTKNPLHFWSTSSKKSQAWFRLESQRFVPRFTLPDPLGQAFSDMVAELVDYRLARYRKRRRDARQSTGQRFSARAALVRGDPLLEAQSPPAGDVDVRLPDGSAWRFRWSGRRCRVAHPVGSMRNQLPDLLRQWFGIEAEGEAIFHPSPDGWWVEPVEETRARLDVPANNVLCFPSLRAAAGWSQESQEGLESSVVALPLRRTGEDLFAVRVHGASMDGMDRGVRDGDWLIMRWARNLGLGAVAGRVALVSREHEAGGQTYHLKRVKRADAGWVLHSDNPDFPDLPARPGDRPIALLVERITPEQLAPDRGAVLEAGEVGVAFGLTEAPSGTISRVDGHLFLSVEGRGALEAPDRLVLPVSDRDPSETAYVLARRGTGTSWTYLGVGRWGDGGWTIPEVDFETWRALGRGRTASRRLDERWLDAARALVEALLVRHPEGSWIEEGGRRLQVRGRASRGGVRIGGEFQDRTVSLTDIAWVLAARERSERLGRLLDESLVNEVRYLDGTPRSSTRWIDTGWALVLVGVMA